MLKLLVAEGAIGDALLRRLELIAQQFTTRLAPIAPLRGTQVERN